MNVVHDPSKKTSITSLLNPRDGSVIPPHMAPMNANGIATSVGPSALPMPYAPAYDSGDTAYGLRAARWSHAQEPIDNRMRTTSLHDQQPQYSYHHLNMRPAPPPHMYPEHYANGSDRRVERPGEYADSARGWSRSDHATPAASYGMHPSSSHYMDDRHVGYSQSDNYPPNYRQYSEPPYASQEWQPGERASVRLAARDTASQNSRYSHSPPLNGRNENGHPAQDYPPQQISVQAPPAHQDDSANRTATKRSQPDSESSSAPKAKKAKDKGKATALIQAPSPAPSGTSRRGYSAKKRQEAATIAAQNATAYQNAQTPDGDQGAESLSGKPQLKLIPELQFARCMSNRYRNEEFTRCVSCTRRWAGDTCRFQGIRYFMRDTEKRLRGISFKEHSSAHDNTKMEFPKRWNRPIAREHIKRSKLSIAKALLPALKMEQNHMRHTELVRRQRETDVRVTCDTCMTSLFSTSFMCRLCGRELCHECFSTVKELTFEPPDADITEKQRIQRMREKHVNANPFFLSCLKRNEHGHGDFTPVTRFEQAELDKSVAEMESILAKEQEAIDKQTKTSDGDSSEPEMTGMTYSEFASTPRPFPDPITQPVYDDFTPPNVGTHITSIPIHHAQVIPATYYDAPPSSSPHTPTPSFSDLWRKGLPLLVKDVGSRFKVTWTPQYFQDRYGDQSCLIVECQTDANRRVNVREFFRWFGEYEHRENCWKLKDWPPTAEFKSAFPELYTDFSNAVPVPDYVVRDGVYNIGSHFPSNALGPDLGPKMYNSMATTQEAGSKGSTRLHMDMADALNVMLHATKCPDGTPGYAAWDLFRAEDSDKIRAFIRKKFANATMNAAANKNQSSAEKAAAVQNQQLAMHDPIHSQQFYLDVQLRKELYDELGVQSIRIYQRPGEGVFIPAGCAHQVANMADSMKIAIDFVSPENIDRCEKLTKEFREQNQLKAWKEDVLQLRTMMWFAWQSCSIREAELDDDDSALGGNVMATAKS